jgi:adenosine deaminase
METLLRLAQERGLEAQSTSLEAFRQKIVLTKPLADLSSVLATFVLFQKVLDRPEVLEQVAFEVVEDCWNEGTRAAELRFSPSFVAEFSGLAWNDVLSGFENGMNRALKKYPEMRAGLICIASRDYGADAVDQVAEFYISNKNRFAGMDLAGNEAQFPCRMFESSFKKIVASGGRITIHAGEASGPENIWEAIELLGAQRIGHGISAIQDPVLMRHLADKQICLEMCPTSNWLTQAVPSLEEHPLPKVLRAGVPVTINTDDPTVFGTTLPQEIQLCWQKMGMSEAELKLCQKHAWDSSFLRNL